MGTLIFLASALVVLTLGYVTFWTVRAVRRVGLRRFAGALGGLIAASLVALVRLIKPELHPSREGTTGGDDVFDLAEDLRIARESRKKAEDALPLRYHDDPFDYDSP